MLLLEELRIGTQTVLLLSLVVRYAKVPLVVDTVTGSEISINFDMDRFLIVI